MTETVLDLGPALRLTLGLEPVRFGLTPEDLFRLALRQNQRRAFLFVSRVLGKHLPIRPAVLPAAGKLLALALEGRDDPGPWAGVLRGTGSPPFPDLMDNLERDRTTLGPEEATLFVGFAETATGLARAVSACYGGESRYVSTTRCSLAGLSPLTFEESHSHAKTHLLHLDPVDPFWTACRRAVIVDDEFTTGSTALKLAEALHRSLGLRRFVLLSLLDWSPEGPRRALAERLGVDIRAVSLLRGDIRAVRAAPGDPLPLDDRRDRNCPEPPTHTASEDLYLHMGRLPLSPGDQAESLGRCRALARTLEPAGPDTLVLGTGELIWEPALIAGFLGAEAFHSTTQSPVWPIPGSAVASGVRFDPPDVYSAAGYLYNVPPGRYRRALILAERGTVRPRGVHQLADWLKGRGCARTEVVLL